jgi:hypothetical protein
MLLMAVRSNLGLDVFSKVGAWWVITTTCTAAHNAHAHTHTRVSHAAAQAESPTKKPACLFVSFRRQSQLLLEPDNI